MGLRFILCRILYVYSLILLGRVIVSFLFLFKPDLRPPGPLRVVIEFLYSMTEPPLQLLRRIIPQPAGLPLDLSFLVLFILVQSVLPRIVC
ncbi:MAG TPA: YggT family protein [Actinomycetota bacterium]|nr:YggT family protein [Actinomycetota bacterium]